MSSSSDRAWAAGPGVRSAILLALVLLLAPRAAWALNVLGVYRAACDRDLGIVVRVERRDVHLLSLAGKLVSIPRHEIVSMAYYPTSGVPLGGIDLGTQFPAFRVQALQDKQLVTLVEGWPIDYSEEKVAFLQRDGKELVINRDSIWTLELMRHSTGLPRSNAAPERIDYVHPQASGFCEAKAPEPDARRVFPQQFLNDEVVIKRELDRLQEGYEKVEKYSHDQIFYPVPEVYRNQTSLGLWLSLGSRHGANNRRSNLTPLLVDELSYGPFGYQHVIMTGSAPNRLLIHEEPQTQIFYAFKAAYFHASVFFDPNLVLVGGKYWGRKEDFAGRKADERWVEVLLIEVGFDLGMFSLQIVPLSMGEVSLGGDRHFATRDENLWRFGPRVITRFFQADITGGATISDNKLWYFRANLDVPILRGTTVGFTGIARGASLPYVWEQTTSTGGYTSSTGYHSRSLVSVFRIRSLIGHRAAVEGQLSLERVDAKFDDPGSEEGALYVKGGVYGCFRF